MEFKLRRGLKNIFAAKVTEDSVENYTADTPFHLIPAGTMSRTVSTDSKTYNYDDIEFKVIRKETETEVEITGPSLKVKRIAELLNKYVDSSTGAVLDTGESEVTYYALGGEAEGDDGSSELFWFLKGYFDAPEESDRTKDDSTDAEEMTIKYHAMRTTHPFTVGTESKNMKAVRIDTDDTVVKAAKDWTEQVVTPDNLGTIVEAVSA